MPDKEGSDDEKKSTKSVVNKKQKQMMGEEGYDIARDMGKVRPSKDKKDATTMPVSKEMKKTQKVNKGPSALERVKAKYGKAVMDVGKKKANEELDLTQVAEAFGGYIVEGKPEIIKKGKRTIIGPGKGEASKETKLLKQLQKNLTATGEIPDPRRAVADDPDFYGRFEPTTPPPEDPAADDGTTAQTIGRMKTYKVNPETLRTGVNPTGERKRGRPVGAKDKTQRYVARNPSKKDEVLAAMTPGQRERNLRKIQRDIDARNPTIQTQVGPVPYRNRRVATTSALVPQYDRTPQIMKPDTDELLKFKDFRKKTKTTTAELDKTKDFKAPPIPKPKKSLEDPITVQDPPTQTQGDDGGTRGKGPRVTTSGGQSSGGRGAYSSIKSFAKTPAGNLISYDMGKGILSKIMKMRRVLSVEKPTKTGRVSAGT